MAIFLGNFYKKWTKLPLPYNIRLKDVCWYYHIKPEKTKAIILHFLGEKEKNKPWFPGNHFYPEWRYNLERANLIDLSKIPPPHKIWDTEEIKSYSRYLNRRRIIASPLKFPLSLFKSSLSKLNRITRHAKKQRPAFN